MAAGAGLSRKSKRLNLARQQEVEPLDLRKPLGKYRSRAFPLLAEDRQQPCCDDAV